MKTRQLLSGALLLAGLVSGIVPQTAAAGQTVPIKLPTYGYVWANQPATAKYVANTGYRLPALTIRRDRKPTRVAQALS